MSTVYEMIGFSGSGKSTFARNFTADKPKVKIVSPDGFRKMFNGEYKYLPEMDDVISYSTFSTAIALLDAGYDVIVDCGNLQNSSDRRGLWRLLPADRFVAIVMPMDKPPQWYVERRMKNPHWETADWLSIVKNEMRAYEPPTLDEFDEIIDIDGNGMILSKKGM
jgi:predicted kinase